MEVFLKLIINVFFQNIEVINYSKLEKKSINSFGDMVSYTPRFKHTK